MDTIYQFTLLLVAAATFVQTVQSLKNVKSIPFPKQVTNMQFYKNKLYIGGTNNIYALDMDLKTVLDVHTCNETASECDNVNKVLVIDEATDKLVICGTGLEGRCDLFNASDLVNLTTTPNSLMVSTDIDRPAQAMITGDGNFIIAITYGSGVKLGSLSNDFNSYQYAISTREMSTLDVLRAVKGSRALILEIYPDLESYLINYKSCFQSGNFSYFVTVQKEYVGAEKNVSKLVRICQDDEDYGAYTDIMIQCQDDKGTVYGIIQNAIITNTVKGSKEQMFFGTFSQENGGSDSDSVICSIDLNKLDTKIIEAKETFATDCSPVNQTTRYLPNNRPGCVTEDKFRKEDFVCKLQISSYLYVIGNIAVDMTSSYRIHADRGVPRSLYGTFQNEYFVMIAGTSNGELIMMNYNNGALKDFSTTVVSPGEPIKAIFAANDDDLYVMSEKQVHKYSNTNCSEFLTCNETITGRNPLCGWCVFKQRATKEASCMSDHWLSSLTECIELTLDPQGTRATDNTIQVSIDAKSAPTHKGSYSYKCLFKKGSEEIGKTAANRISNSFTCQTPEVEHHTMAMLELVLTNSSTEITLAKAPFLFYECQTFRKCGECVTTVGANCSWNSETAMCSEPTTDGITNKSDCPRLDDNTGINFIPASVPSQVKFNASNIPNSANMWCYGPSFGHVKVDKAADDVLSCYLTIKLSKPSKEEDVRVFIKYGNSKDFNTSLAEFEDDYDFTVTVYSCTELARDCSHCKALKNRYDCNWCSKDAEDAKCQYKEDCWEAASCPRPRVTKIVPRDGPWEGGTTVTIFGEELGSSFSEIVGVTVAGRNCALITVETTSETQNTEYFKEVVPTRIVCTTAEKILDSSKYVIVTVNNNKSDETIPFTYKKVSLIDISPKSGPMVGGTEITLSGENLGVGNRKVTVFLGSNDCVEAKVIPEISLDAIVNANFTIQCKIKLTSKNASRGNVTFARLQIDGKLVIASAPVNFTFLPNPEIDVTPQKGIVSGGTAITFTGKNMKNANVAKIEGNFEGELLTSKCDIKSATTTVCKAPKASDGLKEKIKAMTNSRRTKRADCSACIDVEVSVYLDGYAESFTITYFRDPNIHAFEESVHLFKSENQKLTIHGEYINLVAKESDVNITIGLETCSVFKLEEDRITCLAPKEQPASRGSKFPEVNVTIGNYETMVGYLQYEIAVGIYLIVAGVIGGVVAIVIIGAVILMYKYRKVGKKAKEYEKNLSDMEMEIKRVAREEFLDMHTTMSTVNKNLVEQGFPYHSYQQFACNVMFSVDYLWTEPVVSNGKMTDDERLKANKGMESLESLIYNKFFLVSVISTMENEKRFFIREKSNLAGNLCAVLMGKMDYLNEILILLMTNLVQESSAKKHKTLFRRCESITEKLLSNWVSLCLYPHVKSHSGSPLYLLYMATQKTMESGPIDAVTADAKYTLSEEKLLKKWSSANEEDGDQDLKFEAKTLTLNVVVDNGDEIFKCKALDCDTISQVKSKCLNQIYVNYPASQLPVGANDLALEWHEGFGGALKLQDEDNTSKHDGHWVRLNTLAHYNVKDESNMALIDPHNTELNNQEDYVNLANINMDGVCDGSIDSSQPLTPHDEENPHEFEHWHLVKKEEESSKQGKSAIAELYLNRLFTTKQSLMEYMRPLFDIILDHDRCPPPTKFLYDFLDELGEKNKVEAETIHAWKSHSYAIRVWASLMKMPNTLFDVMIPPYMEENLNIISQVFIESFSIASQKFTKDSPSQKLIFHHEMNHYRERVKEFYKNVKVDSQNTEELRQYMADVNKLQQQTNFNKVSALYRFYNQLKPYFEDILENLSKSKEASTLQLDRKLEQVIAIMEEED